MARNVYAGIGYGFNLETIEWPEELEELIEKNFESWRLEYSGYDEAGHYAIVYSPSVLELDWGEITTFNSGVANYPPIYQVTELSRITGKKLTLLGYAKMF